MTGQHRGGALADAVRYAAAGLVFLALIASAGYVAYLLVGVFS